MGAEDMEDAENGEIVVGECRQCSIEVFFARMVKQRVDFGVVMVCG